MDDVDSHLSIGGNAPVSVAPSSCIGNILSVNVRPSELTSSCQVRGGCTDSVASLHAAGLHNAGEMLLYRGTYGSLLRTKCKVRKLLDDAILDHPPVEWLLSIPGFGDMIEASGKEWFAATSDTASQMRMLDSQAAMSRPGANGTLFLMPRIKMGNRRVGHYNFTPAPQPGESNLPDRCRAILEGIGYAVQCLDVAIPNPVKATGGGSRSDVWNGVIATVLGRTVSVVPYSWEALGAALIAAGTSLRIEGTRQHQTFVPEETFRQVLNSNLARAKQCYEDVGWV